MKNLVKRLALLLALSVLVTMAFPFAAFAKEYDEGLENAIKIARTKFDIPEDFEFDHYMETQMNNSVVKKFYYLSWKSKPEAELPENYYVTIDEKGIVTRYSHYKYSNNSERKRLPKYSRSEAIGFADEFLKNTVPEIADRLRYQESRRASYIYETNHYLKYIRVENGVQLYTNTATVDVDSDTGEITSYYLNWTENLDFIDPVEAITTTMANTFYTKNIGLTMIYKYSYSNDKLNIYPVYIPKYGNNYALDALTGRRLDLGNNLYDPYVVSTTAKEKAMLGSASGDANGVALTEEELAAVEAAGKLISAEKAESIARDFIYVNLKDFKLRYAYLQKNWPVNDRYYWNMSFGREATKDNPLIYASVTVDALTGEVLGFYQDMPYNTDSKERVSPEVARAAADKLLKELIPDKCDELVYDSLYNVDYTKLADKPNYFNFNYVRKVNGILFPDNTATIGYDAVNGKIVSFGFQWFNVDFPSIENAITLEKAYDSLFSNIGLELQYYLVKSTKNNPISSPVSSPIGTQDAAKVSQIAPGGSINDTEAILIYNLSSNKPNILDAYTGSVLDYDGKPYVESVAGNYTDISGHAAEKEIRLLAEYSITLGGNEFKPSLNVIQKDFFILLAKAIGYYNDNLVDDADENEINAMYRYLMGEGVVREGEKSPDAGITREEAAKYIIRALKYDKVADLKNIYLCPYSDSSAINPDLIGYVTLAGGLKLMDYGFIPFRPKLQMTRADAAVLIYRFLQL